MISGDFVGLMLLMLTAQGHGGDALNTIPTESYWKAKQVVVSPENMLKELTPAVVKTDISQALKDLESDQYAVRAAAKLKIEAAGTAARGQLEQAKESSDPEVANYARQTLEKLAGNGKELHIRKLMAIRTLGEQKAKSALPALQGLVKSKEPFVAEYASKALATIEGKPWQVTVDAADTAALDADLWMMPQNTGMIAQMGAVPGVKVTVGSILNAVPAKMLEIDGRPLTKEELTDFGLRQTLEIVETLGNARLDSITLAVADDIGHRGGWFVMSGRGEMEDGAELLNKLTSVNILRHEKLVKREQEGIIIYESPREMHNQMALVVKGNHQFVFMVSADPANMEKIKEPILKVLADETGKETGGLASNEHMIQMIKQVDRKQLVWAVVPNIPDEIKMELKRELPFLAEFTGFRGTIGLKDKVLNVKVVGTGTDGPAVSTATDAVSALVQVGLTSLKAMPDEEAEALTPVLEIMESIKVTAKDTLGMAEAQVKASTLEYGLGMIGLELLREEQHRSIRALYAQPIELPTTQPEGGGLVVPGQ